MTKSVRTLSCCFAGLALMAASLPARAEPSASDVVNNLHATLIASMEDGPMLGYAGRYSRLAPVVRQSHDLALIARITTGRHWPKLDPAQQSRFIDTFAQLSISTYADRFDKYAGESFSTISEETLPRGDALVRTKLAKADGRKVQFDYVLRHSEGGWKIINIIVDGVSDLALKRAEYGNILSQDSFDALIQMLHDKIIQHQSGEN